jgi:Transglycosylase SLT domain
MQIMPATRAELRQRYRLAADPYDAHDNTIAGAAYLRELHDRYAVPGFLAAYGAVPMRWEDHLAPAGRYRWRRGRTLARLAPFVGGNAQPPSALSLKSTGSMSAGGDSLGIRLGRIRHGARGGKRPETSVREVMRAARQAGHVGDSFHSSQARSK